MKKSDIAIVVIIAIVGFLASFFGCNALLGNPDEKSVSFDAVNVIDSQVAEPDAEIFNGEAINPTVEVFVGDCNNEDSGDGSIVCNSDDKNIGE